MLKSGPGPRRLKKDLDRLPASEPVADSASRSARRLLDRIIEGSLRVPEALCEMGVKDPAVILAAQDSFIDAVFAFGGTLAEDAYNWDWEDIPMVKPNYKDLARRYGLKFTKKDQVRTEALMERVEKILNPTEAASSQGKLAA